KPESVVLQEDIDSYDALKSYIDRSVHNQFKLGGATSLSSYVQKGVMYRLMNRNFDEITLGYAMKHGAVIQADGSLILSDVAGFLAMANEAGLSVYGHTLCWHVNQNAAYLNKLIEPTVIPGTAESGGGGDAGYAYTFTNQSAVNFWEVQVAYDLPNLENNQEYVLKVAVKATEAGTIRAEIQSTSDYSSNSFGTFAVSPAWHEYEFTTTTTKGDRNRLVISFGDYVGTVYIDNVSLTVKNSASNL